MMQRAIARSCQPAALGRSAGAKLVVMRRVENSRQEFIMALLTLPLLSLMAVSGNPTIANGGDHSTEVSPP